MALKVLVVDDDFINRKLIQTLLKKNPRPEYQSYTIRYYDANCRWDRISKDL
jgi:CheY-like chemotaxis protein